jgi:tetratricopeptide (TPR) repeat protein
MGALDEAEAAYRESARLEESLGNLLGAAQTWSNIATTLDSRGRSVAEIEPWYRKALAVFVAQRNEAAHSRCLYNLAEMVRRDPERLREARELVEQALAMDQRLDPGLGEIWKTHSMLAAIAAQQGDTETARLNRAVARRTFAAAPIARETLRQFEPLIDLAVSAARGDSDALVTLETDLAEAPENAADLVAAIRALLAGTRDEVALCEPLYQEDGFIVSAILRCLTAEKDPPA